ncbi:MAG: histidinol dehydrogenase [Bacteroidales bacterium]|nr:histidinol dehydrogenase [Bacteroidales bacterium]
MRIIKNPNRKEWKDLLSRPAIDTAYLDNTVRKVLDNIKKDGDEAVLRYTEKFDHVKLDSNIVSKEERVSALKMVDSELKSAMKLASENIAKFHEAQKPPVVSIETVPGVRCWQKAVPVERIGMYVPGGTAPLFSTVLMLAIPAKIAGCKELVLCSPPDRDGFLNPAILYAAHLAGVDKIFKIGGIQAIGAMAYGTATVLKVYKIIGPGNQYVTSAKQMVAREGVAIDMPAGPSEVAVLADDTSNPVFIASDLLAQAEHGTDSQAVLITNSEQIIDKTISEIQLQVSKLPRRNLAEKSLEHSKLFLVKDYDEMMELVNAYAPEHLIISTSNADALAEKVVNAGSVFVGEYTPESAGDYVSGTNHTLPTNGYAVAYSGVNLDSYFKKITFQSITREGLEKIGPAIEKMALTEDLTAHQKSVALRLDEKQ